MDDTTIKAALDAATASLAADVVTQPDSPEVAFRNQLTRQALERVWDFDEEIRELEAEIPLLKQRLPIARQELRAALAARGKLSGSMNRCMRAMVESKGS
jgi:predicted PP-loop superfamily ATPase